MHKIDQFKFGIFRKHTIDWGLDLSTPVGSQMRHSMSVLFITVKFILIPHLGAYLSAIRSLLTLHKTLRTSRVWNLPILTSRYKTKPFAFSALNPRDNREIRRYFRVIGKLLVLLTKFPRCILRLITTKSYRWCGVVQKHSNIFRL